MTKTPRSVLNKERRSKPSKVARNNIPIETQAVHAKRYQVQRLHRARLAASALLFDKEIHLSATCYDKIDILSAVSFCRKLHHFTR